jgi:hypothetical protein
MATPRITAIATAIFTVIALTGFVPAAHATSDASISVTPSSGTYHVGDSLTVELDLNTGSNSASSVQGSINTSANLTLASSNTTGHAFDTVIAAPANPSTNTPDGRSGVCSNPTFFTEANQGSPSTITSSNAKLLTLTFTVNATGPATIAVDTTTTGQCDTEVLDGSGSEIFNPSGVTNGSYTAIAAVAPTPTPVPTAAPTATPATGSIATLSTPTPTATTLPKSLPVTGSPYWLFFILTGMTTAVGALAFRLRS